MATLTVILLFSVLFWTVGTSRARSDTVALDGRVSH